MSQLSHLDELEAEAIYIIREVAAECEKPVMLYSIGKDSSVMLHLAMKAFYPEKPPFPFMHIDTTWKFKDMIKFRDDTAKKLGIEMLVYTNEDGVKQGINPFDHGAAYTDIMKTQALKQALTKYGFTAAFGGGRRDEEKSRAKERIFSFRNQAQAWDPKNQRPEMWKLYNTKINKGESIRVFPISNWTEKDIWQYIKRENIDTSQRNIILAHQFVAGFKFGGSEEDFSYSNGDEKNVAGVGIISLDKFQNFDYVALGHIHKPQKISRETIRYSGSLLKYKTSEIDGPDKSVVIIDLKEKGNIEVKLDPIKPLHPFVKIEGLLSELTNTNPNENDYVYLIVDDDKTPIEAKNKLTPYYKRIVDIEFPNDTLQQKMNLDTSLADKRPIDFICEYYREKTNKDLDEKNKKLLAEIFIEANKEGGQN